MPDRYAYGQIIYPVNTYSIFLSDEEQVALDPAAALFCKTYSRGGWRLISWTMISSDEQGHPGGTTLTLDLHWDESRATGTAQDDEEIKAEYQEFRHLFEAFLLGRFGKRPRRWHRSRPLEIHRRGEDRTDFLTPEQVVNQAIEAIANNKLLES